MALSLHDKLVVAGIGLLMIVQNYSFFLAYWDLWSQTGPAPACSVTSFWLGFDTLVCFYVTVMVCGMMLGAWIDGFKLVWWFFFSAHLVGGLSYTVAVFKLGGAIYGDDGKACAATDAGLGSRTTAVFLTQAALYLFYCLCMASLFYMVALRPGVGLVETNPWICDKLVVAGIGLLMIAQNYSFFLAYWDLWSDISSASVCSDVSFWLGLDSFTCFYVTVMVCGMMLGAWIDGYNLVWGVFFLAHLVGGLAYTLVVFKLGAALYSADGRACAAADAGVAGRSSAVYITQAVFYVPYCLCMASLFYQAVVRKNKQDQQGTFVLVGS